MIDPAVGFRVNILSSLIMPVPPALGVFWSRPALVDSGIPSQNLKNLQKEFKL
jgi:hypothetical protein